jgi:hypothetical protein
MSRLGCSRQFEKMQSSNIAFGSTKLIQDNYGGWQHKAHKPETHDGELGLQLPWTNSATLTVVIAIYHAITNTTTTTSKNGLGINSLYQIRLARTMCFSLIGAPHANKKCYVSRSRYWPSILAIGRLQSNAHYFLVYNLVCRPLPNSTLSATLNIFYEGSFKNHNC